jgi:hypothetical protein
MENTQESTVYVFCLDENCVFGWMNRHWIAMMLIFGLTVGVICIAGFTYALQHVPPLVFSAAQMIDPALTGLISWSFGIEGIPNRPTIIGGMVIVMGVSMISSVDKDESGEDEAKSGSSHTDNDAGEKLIELPSHVTNSGLNAVTTTHNGKPYGATATRDDNC